MTFAYLFYTFCSIFAKSHSIQRKLKVLVTCAYIIISQVRYMASLFRRAFQTIELHCTLSYPRNLLKRHESCKRNARAVDKSLQKKRTAVYSYAYVCTYSSNNNQETYVCVKHLQRQLISLTASRRNASISPCSCRMRRPTCSSGRPVE